jgi:16S rRNA (adenine1518-N6/adenine1519-N6)-dimethyltransferase
LIHWFAMSPEKLGQHFLADESWQEQIAEAIPMDAGVWVEIGAGHGEMTARLAQRAKKVCAIELDPRLAAGLRKTLARFSNVELIESDVMAVDFGNIAGGEQFSVYGSLPYYITSPILHRLFEHADKIKGIHIVIQLEVAERIAAEPGRRDYGYLSVVSRWFGQPEIALAIPPEAFQPPPRVDSALLSFRMSGERSRIHVDDETALLEFVKQCFAQKRKTLRNNLRVRLGAHTEEVLREAEIPPGARAEELAVGQLAALFQAVQKKKL